VASADQNPNTETRWGIRPDENSTSSPLDFARWLARRLSEETGLSILLPNVPTPTSGPVTEPDPNDGDEVCVLERGHCPIP
jgi:hypothetical protein